ncbi:MAG: hypothetical protein F4123_06680 [Gemmatimonadetes bacterium]|nr:hypothetical protein [Gemmatimonadota bacterium]MYB96960.1 hypothetical protein [Gemmatimonadota bacterium]MYI46046.1 hypothetical protein [Gemmatimonadota bacterium]
MDIWLALEFAKTIFLVGWKTWMLLLIREDAYDCPEGWWSRCFPRLPARSSPHRFPLFCAAYRSVR